MGTWGHGDTGSVQPDISAPCSGNRVWRVGSSWGLGALLGRLNPSGGGSSNAVPWMCLLHLIGIR